MLVAAAKASAKPFYFMTTRSGVLRRATRSDFLREHGIALIGGTRQGLGAIDRLARWSAPLPARRARTRPAPGSRGGAAGRAGARADHPRGRRQARSSPATAARSSRERLVAGARRGARSAARSAIPSSSRSVSDDIPHRSDLGLVVVGIRDERELARAWEQLQERMPAAAAARRRVAGFLVQEMVAGGVEVFAGVSRDPDFGLVLAFGVGGRGDRGRCATSRCARCRCARATRRR